jgi:hypothetical protein
VEKKINVHGFERSKFHNLTIIFLFKNIGVFTTYYLVVLSIPVVDSTGFGVHLGLLPSEGAKLQSRNDFLGHHMDKVF